MKRGWLGVAGVLLACEAYVGCADVIGIEELSTRADGVGLSGTTAGAGTTGATSSNGQGGGGANMGAGTGGDGGQGGCPEPAFDCSGTLNGCNPANFGPDAGVDYQDLCDSGGPLYISIPTGSIWGPKCPALDGGNSIKFIESDGNGLPQCELYFGDVKHPECGVKAMTYDVTPGGSCVPFFCADRAIQGVIYSCGF